MLVLYESSAGYALFKVLDESSLAATKAADIYKSFETAEQAAGTLKLKAFH